MAGHRPSKYLIDWMILATLLGWWSWEFEPLTSAVRHLRFPFQPLRFHAAIDKEK